MQNRSTFLFMFLFYSKKLSKISMATITSPLLDDDLDMSCLAMTWIRVARR